MTKSPGMSFSLQETELDLTYKSRYRFVQCYCSTKYTFWKEPFGMFFPPSMTLNQGCSSSWSVWASHPWRLCRLPDALCQVVCQLNTVVGGFFYCSSDIWMGEMLQEWWIGGGLEDLHPSPACNWQWETATHQVSPSLRLHQVSPSQRSLSSVESRQGFYLQVLCCR